MTLLLRTVRLSKCWGTEGQIATNCLADFSYILYYKTFQLVIFQYWHDFPATTFAFGCSAVIM